MGYIINNDIILCCPACGYLSVLELINKHYSVKVSIIFLYILILEASKGHMHKFYRIKLFRLSSNFLTVPRIIKRLLNLYCEIFGTCSYGEDTLASSCILCHNYELVLNISQYKLNNLKLLGVGLYDCVKLHYSLPAELASSTLSVPVISDSVPITVLLAHSSSALLSVLAPFVTLLSFSSEPVLADRLRLSGAGFSSFPTLLALVLRGDAFSRVIILASETGKIFSLMSVLALFTTLFTTLSLSGSALVESILLSGAGFSRFRTLLAMLFMGRHLSEVDMIMAEMWINFTITAKEEKVWPMSDWFVLSEVLNNLQVFSGLEIHCTWNYFSLVCGS